MEAMFRDLVQSVPALQDKITADDVLRDLTAKHGFGQYSYLEIGAAIENVLTNIDYRWLEEYGKENYRDVDPVMASLRTRKEAFSWSFDRNRRDRKYRAFIRRSDMFGIRSGITIPISSGYGNVAVMSFLSNEEDVSEKYVLDPVQAAAAIGQVHICIKTFSNRRSLIGAQLKSGELTCLRWAAEGKSFKAISTIEDISYSTVCFHIRNAKKVLGVTTLAQATAVATALGLI